MVHNSESTEQSFGGWQSVIAFIAGVMIAFVLGDIFIHATAGPDDLSSLYPTPADTEVHVHADFIVYLDGTTLDLSDERYMSASNQILHDDIHLHDNEGYLLHRHADGITLAEFFDSIGFTLTDDCFTTDTGAEYCSTDEKTLVLFVNGEAHDEPSSYINNDEDQFLLYYGDPDDTETITGLLGEITDEACIYSLTCPERGTPPPESCGISCEL